MLASICRTLPLLAVFVVCQFAAPLASASSVVTVPFVYPLANTAGQQFDIYVSGDDMINAIDLFMVINGGVGPAPVITAIDVTGPGTLFFGNNTGQTNFPSPDQMPGLRPAVLTTAVSGRILADGLLARVTYDTTGVPAGVYSISLTSHPFGPTDLGADDNFDLVFPMVLNNEFGLPEPSTLLLGGIGAIGLVIWRTVAAPSPPRTPGSASRSAGAATDPPPRWRSAAACRCAGKPSASMRRSRRFRYASVGRRRSVSAWSCSGVRSRESMPAGYGAAVGRQRERREGGADSQMGSLIVHWQLQEQGLGMSDTRDR